MFPLFLAANPVQPLRDSYGMTICFVANNFPNDVKLSAFGITLAPQILCNCVCKVGVIRPIFQFDLVFTSVKQGIWMVLTDGLSKGVSLSFNDGCLCCNIVGSFDGVQQEGSPNEVIKCLNIIVGLHYYWVPVPSISFSLTLQGDIINVMLIVEVYIVAR